MAEPKASQPNTPWVLLMTEGCHLCDEAEHWLAEHGVNRDRYRLTEIIDHPDWLAQWGEKIPVLLHERTGQAFTWPFVADTAGVVRALSE